MAHHCTFYSTPTALSLSSSFFIDDCSLFIDDCSLLQELSLYHDPMLGEQSRQCRRGEAGLLQAVVIGVHDNVEGGAEVGLLQVRAGEDGVRKVAALQQRFGEVRSGEVGAVHAAGGEESLLQTHSPERRVIQHAAVELRREAEVVALVEEDAGELALREPHVPECRLRTLQIAQVAPGEGAVDEPVEHHVPSGQVHAGERALLVLSLHERGALEGSGGEGCGGEGKHGG